MEKRYTAAFFLVIGASLFIGESWVSIVVAMAMVGVACLLVFGKEHKE